MSYRIVAALIGFGMLAFLTGCSENNDATADNRPPSQAGAGAGTATSESYVRIWLDGQAVERDTAVEMPAGFSHWKASRPVSTSPRFKYEITNPRRLGSLKEVTVMIVRQGASTAGGRADYMVYSTDPNAQALIRPGVEHSLARPGEKIGIIDAQEKQVDSVRLRPGEKYTLVLTLKGAQNETAQVDFQTR